MVPPATPGAIPAMRAICTRSVLLLTLAGCAGHQPQQASAPEPNQASTDNGASCSQMGLASWYRGSSRNQAWAEGLVAAHRSLPLGTPVQVTVIDTGRSVVVRINDRGPFRRGRIIDVSRVAAERLGIRGEGVARVRLDPVGLASEDCPFQEALSD